MKNDETSESTSESKGEESASEGGYKESRISFEDTESTPSQEEEEEDWTEYIKRSKLEDWAETHKKMKWRLAGRIAMLLEERIDKKSS